MKHCQQCNLDFPDSFRFCGSCGGSLPDSLTCQGCGDLVESKWTFCTNCGKQLSSQSISEEALSFKTPKRSEMAEAALASSSGPASSPSHGIPLPLSGQPSEKAQAQAHHFTGIEVTSNTLTVTAMGTDGGVIDRAVLTR